MRGQLMTKVCAMGLVALIGGSLFADTATASSLVVDGPGFKVEKRQGWFGRKSSSYQDGLGNHVERKTGLFGRTSSRTKLFGSEAIKNGNNVTVTDSTGKPLVSRKKTLFGGEQTHVNGTGIMESLKNMLEN